MCKFMYYIVNFNKNILLCYFVLKQKLTIEFVTILYLIRIELFLSIKEDYMLSYLRAIKNTLPILFCMISFSCKKEYYELESTTSNKNTNLITQSIKNSEQALEIRVVNVKDQGAKGDGTTDDTKSIRNSIVYAKANGIPIVYFPNGTYSIQEVGSNSGIIKLLNGVSLKGSGTLNCHLKLSNGRHNPKSMFYQAWWEEPTVSNIIIEGIDFNGNLANQTYDTEYQYCHAFSINNGQNIEVKNCKFQSFRGDGCLFGDTFLTTQNQRITYNVNVHDNEFYNIYREGAMFCSIIGGSFYNNFIHGNGFFVGGVDIERHSANETVQNVSVYNNIFDFRDGYGPVERGGPIVRYRRAVTMGFFYKGYTSGIVDNRSSGQKIYGNKIYQGQIDCWGHTNVSITNNFITNYFENINGIGYGSGSAINVSDAGSTTGLIGVSVNNNVIASAIIGNGIQFNHYSNVSAKSNTILGMQLDGINLLNSTGNIDNNTIKDVGTVSNPASGIVINGNASRLVISNNKVINTKIGSNRTVYCAVYIGSYNKGVVSPLIKYNRGLNMISHNVISEFSGQVGYAVLIGNTDK